MTPPNPPVPGRETAEQFAATIREALRSAWEDYDANNATPQWAEVVDPVLIPLIEADRARVRREALLEIRYELKLRREEVERCLNEVTSDPEWQDIGESDLMQGDISGTTFAIERIDALLKAAPTGNG